MSDPAIAPRDTRMSAQEAPSPAVRTFDLALIGRAHERATKTQRRVMAVLTGVLVSFAAGASVFLFLWGLILWPQVTTLQLLPVGLATILAIALATFFFTQTAPKEFGDRTLVEAVITPGGEVTFRFRDGDRLTVLLGDPNRRLLIADYRTTHAGLVDGAPCVINPASNGVPITGEVCDAMVEVARARGLKVSSTSVPLASLSGRALGRAVHWDIRGAKGTLRQIWKGS